MGPLSTINGPYNVTGQTTADFNAPGVNFNGPTRMGSLLQRYPIGGTGDITVTGNFTWSGDEIRGSGPMTVQGNSSLIGAFFSLTLTGRTLRLQGPSNTMTASGLTIRSGGELQIAPGATLDVASGSGGVNNFLSGGGAATINNAGTLSRTVGGGVLTVGSGVVLNNTGLVAIQTGSLAMNGTLKGTGTVSGPVTVGSTGIIAPGASPGTLRITSPVTMSPSSVFQVELGGPIPDIQYDQLSLIGGGSIALNGSALQTLLAYAPSPSDALTIILGGPVSGTFAGLPNGSEFVLGRFNGVDFAGTINYTSTSVVLGNIHPVPEPAAWLLAGGAGLAWAWRRKLRRKLSPAA